MGNNFTHIFTGLSLLFLGFLEFGLGIVYLKEMYSDSLVLRDPERLRELRKTLQMPWVESPFFEEELADRKLPADIAIIARELHENGFAIFDPEISGFDSLATATISDLAPLYQGEKRLTNVWEHHAGVRKIATAPKVLKLLEALYGRDPIPYQTLNFPVGTQQLTHSDSMHFASVPARYMCGVWVPLEDIDENNGPLFYYPGSHRLPTYVLEDLGVHREPKSREEKYAAYEQFLQRLVLERGLKRVELAMKKGQALLWSANLLHGGSPIRDATRSRHSQVTHYFFAGCQYYAPLQSSTFDYRTQFIAFKDIRSGSRVFQPKPPWFNIHRLTSRYRVYQLLRFLKLVEA